MIVPLASLAKLSIFIAACQLIQPPGDGQRAEQMRMAAYKAAQAVPAPELVGKQPDKDLEALELLQPMREHLGDLEKEFAEGIRSGNQPYRNLTSTIAYVRERLSTFETSMKGFASVENITQDVEHVRKMLNMAVQNQAPAYFQPGNDISNRQKSIALRLRALEKISPNSPELKQSQKVATTLAIEVQQAQRSLLDSILQLNQLPIDNYRKTDREELVKLVKETWLKSQPNEKPIQVGLIGSDWTRTKKWEIQNRALYEVDRSRIQGFVVVAHDEKTVACRHIQINRDHTNNEKTAAWNLSDVQAPPTPMELILKSKMK